MKYRIALLAFGFGWATYAHVTTAWGDTITIKVIDEHNDGIYSRVFYHDGTQPPPFANTDQKGEVQQPPATCGKTQALHAHPYDTGAYFDSVEEPCSSRVTLRVLSRQTPKGKAIKYEVLPFTLPDGSPGIMTVKAALESKRFQEVPVSSEGGPENCVVTLNAIADQQIFKVEGEKWIGIAQSTGSFSKVFANAKLPDTQTVTFPRPCSDTTERVQTLTTGAADLLDKSVNKDAVKLNETLRSLGFDYEFQS